ncbi:MAG TPA: VWA domain-containing protein [Tepidisphaeraceae bacterium]|nr:VWA domain-containing protein [Tepidisphaeraceae bacterium]
MLAASFQLPVALRLEYLSPIQFLALFAVFASFFIFTGIRSLTWLDPVRRWTAIGVRLVVLLLFLLIIGGVRWERRNPDVQVVVVRDISQSTENVRDYPGKDLQSSIDEWIHDQSHNIEKHSIDSIGVVSFNDQARVEAMPANRPPSTDGAVRNAGTGTDAAAALSLAMAVLKQGAMHRIVLAWDGNATSGDTRAAVAAAAAAHIPIDVFPLHYDVQNAVLLDKLVAPAWKREKEPFTVDVVLRSTAADDVPGVMRVTDNNQSLAERKIVLHPGPNVEHVVVPAVLAAGLHRFHATFDPQVLPGHAAPAGLDALRSADAFTFVRGKGRILYLDGVADNAGDALLDALRGEGIGIRDEDHISPQAFPSTVTDLADFDEVIAANISRGEDGLSETQSKALAQYVHDTGGGLLMIGGPNAFGAGGWIGSDVEKILPVDCSIPSRRVLPSGALMIVIDHSGSMSEMIGGAPMDKETAADEAAVLALQTLMPGDYFGVIAFDTEPDWVVPLALNTDPKRSAARIRQITPAGGTDICPALVAAYDALAKLTPAQAAVKHIILLTDGDSPDTGFADAVYKMNQAHITLSTVGVGNDIDRALLKTLAEGGKGRYYEVADPRQLPEIFVREATVLRRSLIQENPAGLPVRLVSQDDDVLAGMSQLGPVTGMVLTARKEDPQVQTPLVVGADRDPLLSHWQTGLGRVAAFTSDATTRWAAQWVASPQFGKFWAQVVRQVERAPIGTDLDVRTTVSQGRGHVYVEAIDADSSFLDFLNIQGTLLRPDAQTQPLQLVQTAPGKYEGDFDAREAGSYILAMRYHAKDGKDGMLVDGVSVDLSAELRDLHSNDGELNSIAAATGGRVLEPFDNSANLFTTDGLWPSDSLLPIWDWIVPFLLAAFLLDVTVRRIAWDWQSLQYAWSSLGSGIRSITATRQVAPEPTLSAWQSARRTASERFARTAAGDNPAGGSAASTAEPRPQPKARFTAAKGVEGDIAAVVGGARSDPRPGASAKPAARGAAGVQGDVLSGLRAAKERARQRIADAEGKEPKT